MKFTKQDLLTLLIGLFLFASCKSTNTIGFEPAPGEKIEGTLEDGLTVNSVTETDEPVNTIGAARYPLGFINGDPIFGNTEASIVLAVNLPGDTYYNFGKEAMVDSAVLVLPYSTQFYGDTTTSNYAFNVNQLNTDLSLQRSFLSNREWAVEPALQGSFLGKLLPKTPVKITDIVSGAADTIKTAVPQVRIKLQNAFVQDKIVGLDSARISSNTKFRAAFKGLKISVNKTASTGRGGIAFFGFGGSDASVEIYYKKQNASNSTLRDTVSVKFPINAPVAATIKHDYTGTPVKTQLDAPSPTTPYPVSYLQAMTGIRTKLSFPDLKDFVTRIKAGNANAKLVVNRAELVINLNSGTDVAPFTAAQRLALYRLDIAGQRKNIPDNDAPTASGGGEIYRYAGSEAAFGGFYDSTNKRYIFTVTAYIQDLIDGKTEDYGTYLAPSSLTEYNLTPSITSGARAVINSRIPGTGQKPIKLNIYYSRVAE